MERIGYLAWMDYDALFNLATQVSECVSTDIDASFLRCADGELDRRYPYPEFDMDGTRFEPSHEFEDPAADGERAARADVRRATQK